MFPTRDLFSANALFMFPTIDLYTWCCTGPSHVRPEVIIIYRSKLKLDPYYTENYTEYEYYIVYCLHQKLRCIDNITFLP